MAYHYNGFSSVKEFINECLRVGQYVKIWVLEREDEQTDLQLSVPARYAPFIQNKPNNIQEDMPRVLTVVGGGVHSPTAIEGWALFDGELERHYAEGVAQEWEQLTSKWGYKVVSYEMRE